MVNYRFDTFKKFKQFDVVSMIEMEELYQNLIDNLWESGWTSITKKLTKSELNKDTYIYDKLPFSKIENGFKVNIGLNLNKKTIEVDTERFETNQKGIYAVGDICNYPGKLKLILSGFHEGALAARACFKLARPNEKYRFEFTTTSSNLLKRLGKKE